MDEKNINQIVHDLAYGKFINRLIVDYKDIKLTDGQLYYLYQSCCNYEDFEEIINTGAAEHLP